MRAGNFCVGSLAWLAGGAAFAQTYPTDPGDFTITELMVETTAVPDYYGEWFEVRNNSGRRLDLNGITVVGGDSGESLSATATVLLDSDEYARSWSATMQTSTVASTTTAATLRRCAP